MYTFEQLVECVGNSCNDAGREDLNHYYFDSEGVKLLLGKNPNGFCANILSLNDDSSISGLIETDTAQDLATEIVKNFLKIKIEMNQPANEFEKAFQEATQEDEDEDEDEASIIDHLYSTVYFS